MLLGEGTFYGERFCIIIPLNQNQGEKKKVRAGQINRES